jgi:hypothetical protein
LKPASITANRKKKELAIIWDEGLTSLYTFSHCGQAARTCTCSTPAPEIGARECSSAQNAAAGKTQWAILPTHLFSARGCPTPLPPA